MQDVAALGLPGFRMQEGWDGRSGWSLVFGSVPPLEEREPPDMDEPAGQGEQQSKRRRTEQQAQQERRARGQRWAQGWMQLLPRRAESGAG